jgi:hypothetical protein
MVIALGHYLHHVRCGERVKELEPGGLGLRLRCALFDLIH